MSGIGRTALAVLRMNLLFAWAIGLWVVWMLTWPVRALSTAADIGIHRWLVGLWGGGTVRIMGVAWSTEGTPPPVAGLVVSNHLSYLDIFLLSAALRTRFLSKAEVANWPVMGLVARTSGTLFVDRERRRDLPRVVAEIQGVLERGQGVVFFPEGTSSPGREVLPFKPSLFEVAIRTGATVYCASLTYSTPPTDPPAHMAVCWWGDMEFIGHLFQLLRIPRTRARIVFAPETLDPSESKDRKDLAEAAHELVSASFQPVVTDPA